jgi:hypothetical protein
MASQKEHRDALNSSVLILFLFLVTLSKQKYAPTEHSYLKDASGIKRWYILFHKENTSSTTVIHNITQILSPLLLFQVKKKLPQWFFRTCSQNKKKLCMFAKNENFINT